MNSQAVERELFCLSQAVYRLRKALERGDFREAVEAYDAAKAYNENVAGELGRVAARIGERDLTAELADSVDAVKGRDDAA